MTERKASYWDAVASAWQEARPQSLWRIHSDAINSMLLENWLQDGRIEHLLKTDLFDETFSEGLYPMLTSRAENVVGIDLSALVVHTAKTCYPGLQVVRADVRHLPFADGTFDVIVSNSTLDHFETSEEIIASLRELNRVLRKNGQLLLTLDNPANPIIALRNALPFTLLHRLGIVPYYVGATFGPQRLQSILRQLNFDVVEITAFLHFPRVIAVLITNMLENYSTTMFQKGFLRFLLNFERLSKWPTKFLTGHFVGARAIKR